MLYLFIILGFINFIYGGKLNVVRVLLPHNTGIPTNYTLEISEGGCYKWSSSRPDVVSLILLDEDPTRLCSTRSQVIAQHKLPNRQTAIIFAEDEATGQTLRCDVIVDSIHSIEIVTRTRELFLEDVPVAFEVQAKNDQNDTFSSLEGLPFEWQIHPSHTSADPDYSSSPVLRFLKFSDSPYETPSGIHYWEQRGHHGYMILMEGLRTGSAKVSVKPQDLFYKNVEPSEISLIIMANLMLIPSQDIYMLQGTSIHYKVELIKQRKRYAIPMPSSQYYLELDNTNTGVLDVDTSTFYSHSYGQAKITLKDRNIDSHEIIKEPTSNIYVVTPMFMNFHISPGNKWSLLEQTRYVITVQLFDAKYYPIFLSENVRIDLKFPSKHFQVISSTENGTHHEIRTLVPGSCTLSATLIGVLKQDGELLKFQPKVVASQDLVIYQKVEVLPPFTLLPWDPILLSTYNIPLHANGGTGFFRWYTNDSSVASLSYRSSEPSPTTIVTTLGKPGTISVRCHDAHNSLFTSEALVSIQPPSKLEILPTQWETAVNSTLTLSLALYGLDENQNLKMFGNCSSIPLSIHIDDTSVAEALYQDGPAIVSPQGCRWLRFQCLKPGHVDISITYEEGSLSASTLVGCYHPLHALHPTRHAILTIGSSIDVAFKDGPKPWPFHPDGHVIKAVPESSSTLRFHSLEQEMETKKSFRVLCTSLGTSEFTLVVENEPSETNPFPARSQSSVIIECSEPSSISLKPLLSHVMPKCSYHSSSKVKLYNYEPLEIGISVHDKQGRKFYNFTSLELNWSLADPTLGSLSQEYGIDLIVDSHPGYSSIQKYYNTFFPQGVGGVVKVAVESHGYHKETLIEAQIIYPPALASPLHQHLVFELVEDAVIVPSSLTIFNHPKNKGLLKVLHGSGQFSIESSGKAQVIFLQSKSLIEVTPVEDESFTLKVVDLCLKPVKDAVAHIQVSGVTRLKVLVANQVEEGQSILAHVEALDSQQKPLPGSLLPLLELEPVISSSAIAIKAEGATNKSLIFSVEGVEIGVASLSFRGYNGITSELISIQVFAPLRLNPDSITLIVGASFQVGCRGGPQPHSNVEFTLLNGEVAKVNSVGLITATAVGTTKLSAHVAGSKHGLSHSQAQITVNVVTLKGIKIHIPLTTIQVGTQIPVYIMGLNSHENPFSFGSAVPHLIIKWSYSGQDIVSLSPVLEENHLGWSEENNFAILLQGRQPGLATLKVQVGVSKRASAPEVEQLHNNAVFADEVQIKVIEDFQVIKPNLNLQTLLLAPNAGLHLHSNRDGISKVNYTLLSGEGITVDSGGFLQASSRVGSQAAIEVTSATDELPFQQSLVIFAEIQPQSFLNVHGEGGLKVHTAGDHPFFYIPLGLSILLEISFHDRIGREFHATTSQIKFRPSRYDLIQVSPGMQNNTLRVQSLKAGYTVLKVWESEHPHLSGYVLLQVGSAIRPSNVHLFHGQLLCFSSPLVSAQGQRGKWQATGNALMINPNDGLAVAFEPGLATLYYILSPTISTSTQVVVHKVTSLKIDPNSASFLSDIPVGSKHHLIPISMEAENGLEIISTQQYQNCTSHSSLNIQLPLSCELKLVDSQPDLSLTDLFFVEPWYSWDQGQYFCKITPLHTRPTQQSSLTSATFSLRATLADISSNTITLSLLPHFYVFQEEIVLSPLKPSAVLIVSALPSVLRCLTASSTEPDLISISGPESDPAKPNMVLYQVKLMAEVPWPLGSPLAVTLMCGVTRQAVEIPIVIKGYASSEHLYGNFPRPWLSIWSTSALTVIALAVTLGLIILGYHYYMNNPIVVSPTGNWQHDRSIYENFPHLSTSPKHHSPTTSPRLWTANDSFRSSCSE